MRDTLNSFMRSCLGWSTNDAVVFAMRNPSILEKNIHFNRAKRSGQIKAFLKTATAAERDDFVRDMFMLESMLAHYVSVSERLTIFIDNNIIQDILQKNSDRKRNQRFHSFLAVLCLAQDYYMVDILACVSPAVLFEACGKPLSASVLDAEAVMSKVVNAIAEAGLPTHFFGFNSTKQLLNNFGRIKFDERKIRRALDKVLESQWERNFTVPETGSTKIPFGVAEQECPLIRLKYFDSFVVKLIFMHIIEKRMYAQNQSQPKARGFMMKAENTGFSILKRKRNGIEGLGDIELLTYCDLTSQTQRSAREIIMGFTYDERLHETLRERSTIMGIGPSIEGGVDSVEDFSLALASTMWLSQKRTDKANRRMREYSEALCLFIDDVLREFISPKGAAGEASK